MTNNDDKMISVPAGNDHTIPLKAVWSDGKHDGIKILGNGDYAPKRNSGPHKFTFVLTDDTHTNVRFKPVDDQDVGLPMLWGMDDCDQCPPQESTADQLHIVKRKSDTEASFHDKNDNRNPMKVGYQLNFECDDRNVTCPIEFDPILTNGGKN